MATSCFTLAAVSCCRGENDLVINAPVIFSRVFISDAFFGGEDDVRQLFPAEQLVLKI